MLDPAAAYVNVTGAFPDVEGVNASGPSATDGFEFIANFVNDNNLGIHQMILNHASLSPNGVVESDSASQIKEALQKGFGGAPGTVQQWHLASDPGVTGHRCLLLSGQGVLRTSYPVLDAAVYVGDGNNAAVAAAGGAYYHADDAAGTIPNIAGIYLILPETRGYAARGLDLAASVDPLGAARFLGDPQVDAVQGHYHNKIIGGATEAVLNASVGGANGAGAGGATLQNIITTGAPVTDGTNGTPRISSETRMVNYSTKWVIWY